MKLLRKLNTNFIEDGTFITEENSSLFINSMVKKRIKILTRAFDNLEIVNEGNESSDGTRSYPGSESEDCFNPKLLDIIQPSSKK